MIKPGDIARFLPFLRPSIFHIQSFSKSAFHSPMLVVEVVKGHDHPVATVLTADKKLVKVFPEHLEAIQ